MPQPLIQTTGRRKAAIARVRVRNGTGKITVNKRPVEEYFRTQLMADCMVFREEGLRHLVAELGVGQVVFGTDQPFAWPVTPDFILNAKSLNDAQKEQILGGNLIKLLKLSPATTA